MPSNKPRVVTIGGANAERVLVVDPDRFRLGGKHTLRPEPLLAGGSAVNHACRLLATGTPAEPIVPACRDATGDVVLATLREAATRGGLEAPGDGPLFMDAAHLATPFTTIVTVGTERTIYTEFSKDLFEPYASHLRAALTGISKDPPGAVMIGHVHADRERAPGYGGALTESVIDACHQAGVPIFANFGSAQYQLGADHWEDALPKIACFQLGVDEARAFVASARGGAPTLMDILDWFQSRCTIVITMERMGAVARLAGSPNVVLTWPYHIEVQDPTGAGDAFGAGLVSSMLEVPLADDAALERAMDRGGLFAARACTTRGGADDCPTSSALDEFRASNAAVSDTEIMLPERARQVVELLDRAFPIVG